ncbi:MAG: hypothetical protein JWM02_1424 [Frankiales bacterium]|nr:hypothetical protein [Frankiales bacterium]
MDVLDAVTRLRVTGQGTPAAQSDGDDDWLDEDELLDDLLPDSAADRRWASWNGFRLTGLRLGSRRRVVALRLDLNEREVSGVKEIARGHWFSEGGGAPISWDGGSSVSLVARDLTLYRCWGDQEAETAVQRVANTSDIERVLAAWVVSESYSIIRALNVGTLDPNGTLTLSDRAKWMALLTDISASCVLAVEESTAAAIHRRLRRTSTAYRDTLHGLDRPRSAEGRALRHALEDCSESGVLGVLLSG